MSRRARIVAVAFVILGGGATEAQVIDAFVAKYGERSGRSRRWTSCRTCAPIIGRARRGCSRCSAARG